MTLHLEHKIVQKTRCDLYYQYNSPIYTAVWCDYYKEWIDSEKPDCEVCILMDFSDPNNTSTCKCGENILP